MSTETSAPSPAHDTHHVGEDLSADEFGEGQHGATDKQYIIIAVILAAITAAEVTLSYVDVGWIFLPALLIMMVAKFLIVVSFFMHLKFDHKIFSFMFYMGLILAVAVYVAALTTFEFWTR
jgi:cytochrome c oxidase subunit 4